MKGLQVRSMNSSIQKKIRVMSVEDDPDFRFLINALLEREQDFILVGSTDNRNDAIEMSRHVNPHIVLMDLNLVPGKELGGIEAAKEIRLASHAKVILLTAIEDPQVSIEASKKSFASGYIFKSQFELIPETLRATAWGSTPQEDFIKALILSELSVAEKTVLEMILGKDIRLLSSDKTIANQKTKIFKKLGVRSGNDLVHLLGSFRSLRHL